MALLVFWKSFGFWRSWWTLTIGIGFEVLVLIKCSLHNQMFIIRFPGFEIDVEVDLLQLGGGTGLAVSHVDVDCFSI